MKQGHVWIWVAVLVLLGFLVWPRSASGGGDWDALASCLTDSGAKMYGAFWCSHCKAQKEAFGSAWSKVNYIECSTADGKEQLPVCQQAGIQGYPTWEFGDVSRASGELSFAELSSRSGC